MNWTCAKCGNERHGEYVWACQKGGVCEDPAHPQPEEASMEVLRDHSHEGEEAAFTVMIEGLSKRELFAAMAMQGLLCGSVFQGPSLAESAVQHADALIAELAK